MERDLPCVYVINGGGSGITSDGSAASCLLCLNLL
jgi:hypothetical protein